MVPTKATKTAAYPCVYCKLDVSGRQHALSCSVCNRWQHRKCHTGIDHVVYRFMMQGDFEFKWKCLDCRPVSIFSNDETEKVPKMQTLHRPTVSSSVLMDSKNIDQIQNEKNKKTITEYDLINTDSDDSNNIFDFKGFDNSEIHICENPINTVCNNYAEGDIIKRNSHNFISDHNYAKVDIINGISDDFVSENHINTICNNYTEGDIVYSSSDESDDFEGFDNKKNAITNNHTRIERTESDKDSDEELDIEYILTQLNSLPCRPGEKCTCNTDFTSQVPKYIVDLFTIMPENKNIIIIDDDEIIYL